MINCTWALHTGQQSSEVRCPVVDVNEPFGRCKRIKLFLFHSFEIDVFDGTIGVGVRLLVLVPGEVLGFVLVGLEVEVLESAFAVEEVGDGFVANSVVSWVNGGSTRGEGSEFKRRTRDGIDSLVGDTTLS